MNSLSNLHELCREIVNWAGSCPEATVSAWLVSIVMGITQIVFLVKRMVVGKGDPAPKTLEVEVPVVTPYVPGDTVLKILKLLTDKDDGWGYNTSDYGYNQKNQHLSYGNLTLTKINGVDEVKISQKGVDINLLKRSEQPDLDRILIKDAFVKRCRMESQKHASKRQMLEREAEVKANRELTDLLENYV